VVDARSSRCRSVLLAVLATAALLAACSDDGSADASSTTERSSTSTSSSTSSSSTTTSTQPPGTDAAAVEPFIADLLERRDSLAIALRQDPTAVRDDEGAFEDYSALFTPDSPQLRDFRTSMEGVADDGHADRAGPSGVLEVTHLDSMLPSTSPDVAVFQVCAFTDYETYDVASGQSVSAEAVKVVSGAEAHRVNGVWLLHDFLDPDPNLVETLPSGTADPCELEG
jgi:hypothetical protein